VSTKSIRLDALAGLAVQVCCSERAAGESTNRPTFVYCEGRVVIDSPSEHECAMTEAEAENPGGMFSTTSTLDYPRQI
jgi:hypothetical protein